MGDQALSVVTTPQESDGRERAWSGPRSETGVGTDIEDRVRRVFDLVGEAVSSATHIFLEASRDAARALVQRDQLIDELTQETERMVLDRLDDWGAIEPATRRRMLMILQLLPELERSGDLAEHIASHASQGLANGLTPRARNLVGQMGALGAEMWRLATEAYSDGNGACADLLRVRDDEIDDLHVSLTSELAADRVSVPVAIEMALVARYFERLGDHAVNVTRRLQAGLSAG